VSLALTFGPLVLGLIAQAPPSEKDNPDIQKARLEFMKASLVKINVHPVDDSKAAFRLLPDPVLRFTNSVGDVKDGAIFLWLGPDDRPAAAVQVFLHRNQGWFQEFSTLSTTRVAADGVWGPTREAIVFKPVPDAPKPAETPEQRLRQMRALIEGFSGEQDMHKNEQTSWDPLRFLTKPLARYGKPGTDVLDGALFALVLTTDPEVYLMLEVRPGKDGPEWQYAFAAESTAALRCSLKGRRVWELPLRQAWLDRLAPYYIHYFNREP